MSKKSIEEKFSIQMDAYLKGIQDSSKTESRECDDLLELGKFLGDKDFSAGSDRKAVMDRVLKNIDRYKGETGMKKSSKLKRSVVAAALVCVIGIPFMQTSFAQDLVGKIVNTISLGHITVYEESSTPEIKTSPVPEQFKGKIFDKDGKPIEVFSSEYTGKYYTAGGEEIARFNNDEITTVSEREEMKKVQTLVVRDSSEINKYTCFNVILPSYLPEGYKFDKAEFFKDENGVVSNTKYVSLYFTNEETEKYIYMQQRYADEETAYATGASEVEQIKINGADAVIYNNRNIDWENNNTIYALSGRGEISKDELIKIAESIK
ncbi:DUF4367 domain-containing protein [Brassicibacter mesophilus]|uniref:DUF4367 domain-containing protein n=1 Tax=Brassicibacter mesophilus TaxID=745119 RepID=UPI003D224025